MSKQGNFNNTRPINPIYGMIHELGREPEKFLGWDVECTRHYWRKARNYKHKTLRTHRTGDCAMGFRKEFRKRWRDSDDDR